MVERGRDKGFWCSHGAIIMIQRKDVRELPWHRLSPGMRLSL
jgi:hypothetical protein